MFTFTDDYKIGIKQIDEEHEQLVALINETEKMLAENNTELHVLAKNFQKKLKEYAQTHFTHEEQYMELHDDPELPLQKKEHMAFINKVAAFQVDDTITKKDLEDMMQFMARWLFGHILSSDVMIGQMKDEADKNDPFAFTDDYITGVHPIDTQHKQLFAIIKEANDLISEDLLHDKYDKIMEILDRLQNYTREHFSDEEEYMKEIGYPKLEEQMRAHEAFIDKLVHIDMNELDAIDDNQQDYLIRLIDFLLTWLSNHILKADKQIGKYAATINQQP